jgi:hypothetical protein
MVQTEGQISAAELAAVADRAPGPARFRARIRPEPSCPPTPPHTHVRSVARAVAAAMAVVVLAPRARRNEPNVPGDRKTRTVYYARGDGRIASNGLLPRLAPAVHRPAA